MLTARKLPQLMVQTADVAICPDTKDIYWSDFSRVDELIEAGIMNTKEKLPEIRHIIRRKSPWYRRISLHTTGKGHY